MEAVSAQQTLPSGLRRKTQAGLASSWCHNPVFGSFRATCVAQPVTITVLGAGPDSPQEERIKYNNASPPHLNELVVHALFVKNCPPSNYGW